jgi:hypothetical protein
LSPIDNGAEQPRGASMKKTAALLLVVGCHFLQTRKDLRK